MRPFALAALVCLLAGCDDATEPRSLQVVSTSVTESSPHVWSLAVELSEPAPISVSYAVPGAGPQLRVQSPVALIHTVPLTRLRAASTYRYEIEGTSHTGTFQTDALPPDLAAVQFTPTGTSSVPLVLLHLFHPDGFKGYAIIDSSGEVVWYWRTLGFPYGMTRRAEGSFVFLEGERGLVEVSSSGAELSVLPQIAERNMHHDVVASPSNTLLVIAFDERETDGGPLLGEAIWEWTPETGEIVKRWSAWDHFSPDTDRGPRFGTEWMHANALSIGPRGNVLMSVHYFNQVISIAPGWQSLEWRLGGVNATLPLTGDAQFTGQHSPTEIATDRVLLFDNRSEQGGYSRAVEYSLAGGAPTVAWEWRATPDNYAAIVSSARRLPNGNTLVDFGVAAGVTGSSGPTEVYEVTSAGESVWHLLVNGPAVMYRAEPLAAIGSEAIVAP